jgi:hypothetical protein
MASEKELLEQLKYLEKWLKLPTGFELAFDMAYGGYQLEVLNKKTQTGRAVHNGFKSKKEMFLYLQAVKHGIDLITNKKFYTN